MATLNCENLQVQVKDPGGAALSPADVATPMCSWFPGFRGVCLAGAIFVLALLCAAPAGAAVLTFGGFGTAPGKFNRPWNLAVSPANGHVYVTDFNNSRVQEFTADGAFVRTWGSPGTGDTNFANPRGIAVAPNGDVYVADLGNNRVLRFNATGAFETKWGDPNFFPQDLVVTAGSDVLVANDSPARKGVERYSPDGVLLGSFGAVGDGALAGPVGIGASSASVFVADQGPDVIRRYSLNGSYQGVVGGPGSGAGQFIGVSDVAVGSDGSLYVVDVNTYRVQKFGPTGNFVFSFGGPGTTPGLFGPLPGVALDGAGRVYVTDINNHRVQRLDPDAFRPRPTYPLPVGPTPPPGPIGVSINAGARFTNDPNVLLRVVWPPGRVRALVSNDGGFGSARQFPLAERIPWRLDSSGSERLPKTVYLRFDGHSQTFQDDIILDETRPTLGRPTFVAPKASVAGPAARSRTRTYRIRLRATDNASGVIGYQTAIRRSRPERLRRFSRRARSVRSTVRVRARTGRLYVRVRDAASNNSKWRRVARQTRRR